VSPVDELFENVDRCMARISDRLWTTVATLLLAAGREVNSIEPRTIVSTGPLVGEIIALEDDAPSTPSLRSPVEG
jgi:hypothetical protein